MAGYTVEQQKEFKKLKNKYYILAILVSYGIPIVYFSLKYGITKEVTQVVTPLVFSILLLAIKMSLDIPSWVGTWEPSFKKGLIRDLPKIVVFLFLITLGVQHRYKLKNPIDVAFK